MALITYKQCHFGLGNCVSTAVLLHWHTMWNQLDLLTSRHAVLIGWIASISGVILF